jgi:hypothetical protein
MFIFAFEGQFGVPNPIILLIAQNRCLKKHLFFILNKKIIKLLGAKMGLI